MRVLRWNTLWGRRLPGESIAPLMMGVVLVFCLFLSLSGAWVDYRLRGHFLRALEDPQLIARVFVHILFGWTGALLALIIGVFALAHYRSRRTPEALILASTLPAAALFEILHAWSWFSTAGLQDDLADQTRIWLWFVARLSVALPLVAAGTLAVYRPFSPRLGHQLFAVCSGPLGIALGLVLLGPSRAPAMMHADSFLVRPWELVPLALFGLGGLVIFPQLHRQRPTVLSHALMLSMFPQALAQVEATFSLFPEDGHSMLAHLHALVALVTLLAGVIFDYVYTQRSRENAVQEVESAQIELRTKARELVRVDRERVDQDQKRRRAERTLAILEKAVETMSLGVTVTDPAGKILYVNPADAGLHGYIVEELLGRNASMYSPHGMSPSEDSESMFLHPWTRERMNITRDGRTFPVRLVSDMVRDTGSEPMALVTLCEDISDRKRIEAALKRRDRILESVGLAAERFLVDSSWEASVEEVLESLKQATQVDRVRLVWVEDLKPHDLDDTWSALDPMRDTSPGTLEGPIGHVFPRWERELSRGRLVQGRVRHLPAEERRELAARGVRSFAVVPIFVAGDWLGYLSFEDHDDEREWSPAELEVLRTAARTFGAAMHRKHAELALAASQARYQDLLENASDLVQSVSPEGRFQFVNRAWIEALGYSQQEVGRLILWDVIHPDHHKRFAEVMKHILAGGPGERVEVVFVARGGQEIYLEGSLNAGSVADEAVATRGIFRDITERTIIDRMKGEFVSTISHELRTPLTSIIASLGLLRSGRLTGDAERTSELVTVAHRNSKDLLQLINDLLDLPKLAAGQIVYRFLAIDTRALLEEALLGIQAFADSFDIHLKLGEVTQEKIWADHDRLIQVLNNLLSNAIKFSASEGVVTVSAQVHGEYIRVAVADRGTGIPEEFRPRLFERFTQVDSSATRSAGGSGLGLSIVKGLVEGMRGLISLETEIGEGTTIYIDLPRPP